MKYLYLDIDGVILTKKGNQSANHLLDFLKFVTSNYNCYWLTTHCHGDVKMTVEYLKLRISEETYPYLEKIKPTKWDLWKTEGIDFSKDFLWLDDYAFDGEKKILKEHQVLEKLVIVDLKSNPDQLLDFMKNKKLIA